MAYAIVRTDLMTGTDDRAHLVSFKYKKSGALAAIENGSIVTLKELYKDEGVVTDREVWEAADMEATTPLHDLVLVASVEDDDDDNNADLSAYINVAGHICRGYYLHSGNMFSVTKEALTGTPTVGHVVECAAGTKMAVNATNAASTTKIGTIVAEEVVGGDTYYVIRVA